tara:strand:- start:941 stop:1081 length:141 start_codon:yes stop_codon:yes gene_type:complete
LEKKKRKKAKKTEIALMNLAAQLFFAMKQAFKAARKTRKDCKNGLY